MQHNYTNHEYAVLFQRGDEKGLAFIFDEFYATLVLYSNRWVNNTPVAEEIASEAIIKTWRMHHKLDSYAAIRAYLYKVAYHDSLETLHKEKKGRMKTKDLQLSDISNETPFDNLVKSETYGIIHRALKDLPPGQQKILMMHYLDGKSTGEIARELSLHKSTVKTQKQNGLKALKKRLYQIVLLSRFYFNLLLKRECIYDF